METEAGLSVGLVSTEKAFAKEGEAFFGVPCLKLR